MICVSISLKPSILLVDTNMTPFVPHSTQWASIDVQCYCREFPEHHPSVLRWVKAGSGYGQALLRPLTTASLWRILKA